MSAPSPRPSITFAAAGTGPRTIVFLHGIGLDGESFRGQLEACAAAGWRAIGWNMPGYAGSAFVEGLTTAKAADALAGLLDGLGVAKAVLVGHSLGGFVALDFAARLPERLAGLVLVGTTPAFGSKDGSFEKEFIRQRFEPLDAGRGMADLGPGIAAGIVGADAPAALKDRIAATFAAIPERAYRASVTSMLGFDRRAALGAIAAPTLVVAGDLDRNAPLKTVERMAGSIPRAHLEVMAATGHCPHLERPEGFNQILLDFLASLPSQ